VLDEQTVCLVAGFFGDPWRRAESKAQGRAANLRLLSGARDANGYQVTDAMQRRCRENCAGIA
jgi:hypothetical protein